MVERIRAIDSMNDKSWQRFRFDFLCFEVFELFILLEIEIVFLRSFVMLIKGEIGVYLIN